MQTKLTERFLECVQLIKTSHNISSNRKLAKETQIHHQCYSDLSRGIRAVSLDMITKFASVYNVDANYILTGKGSPLINANSDSKVSSEPIIAVVTDNEGAEKILHVPYAAQAGYTDQFLDPIYLKELPTFTLPDSRFSSGTYRCFDVSGDSMEPALFSGEKVVCNFVESENWESHIRNNFVYVLVTDSGIIVKRIKNNIPSKKSLTIISDNSYYESYPMPISRIKEIWQVTYKIAPFMPSPNNIRNGLHTEVENLRSTIAQQGKIIQSLNTTIEKMLKQNRQVSVRF